MSRDAEEIRKTVETIRLQNETEQVSYNLLRDRNISKLRNVVDRLNEIRRGIPETLIVRQPVLNEARSQFRFQMNMSADHWHGGFISDSDDFGQSHNGESFISDNSLGCSVTYDPSRDQFRFNHHTHNKKIDCSENEIIENYKSLLAIWIVQSYPYERKKYDSEERDRKYRIDRENQSQREKEQKINDEKMRKFMKWLIIFILALAIARCTSGALGMS